MPNFSLIRTYWGIGLWVFLFGFISYVGIGHRYTKNVFSEIEAKLEDKKAEGIDVKNVQIRLDQGKGQWKILNYFIAIELAREAERKLLQLSNEYANTETQLLNVEKNLLKLKDSGVNVASAMEILEKSRDALSKMNFEESHNSSALAEERGIELEKEYLLSKEKIANLKEKIKHLSNRKIKAPELKKLLKTMEKEVGK
jgi:hypothetical protein